MIEILEKAFYPFVKSYEVTSLIWGEFLTSIILAFGAFFILSKLYENKKEEADT